MADTYQILDEPRPGALASLAVNPMWPLLGAMLGGAWLAVPWFILNALALGSPTRGREIALSVASLVGGFGVALGLLLALDRLGLSIEQFRYLAILLTLWKIGLAYAIYLVQRRTFALFEYYGGQVRNPLLVLVGATVARQSLVGSIDSPLLLFTLA